MTNIRAEIGSILGIPEDRVDDDPSACVALRVAGELHADGADRSEPVRAVLARIGDHWTPLLVQFLEPKPLRFSILRKMVIAVRGEDISKQVLSDKLHSLERDGFVHRADLGGARPAVEYSLTPIGVQLANRINELIAWGRALIPAVRAARNSYDAKPVKASHNF